MARLANIVQRTISPDSVTLRGLKYEITWSGDGDVQETPGLWTRLSTPPFSHDSKMTKTASPREIQSKNALVHFLKIALARDESLRVTDEQEDHALASNALHGETQG